MKKLITALSLVLVSYASMAAQECSLDFCEVSAEFSLLIL